MNREIEKMDFLAPENDCGQSLLKLAAAGSTIIAELLRLSNHIPDVFTFESKKHDITEEEIKDKLGEKLKE
jgi:WASH complex subunit strumpellin